VIDLLNDQPNIKILGEHTEDHLGVSTASEDVNGDGIDDIILGADDADYSDRMDVGKAYVISIPILPASNSYNDTR
jgi:hypothetical protein